MAGTFALSRPSGRMIITCPHCQTKYQVTYEAIGSAGRKVQCAHCQQAWQQDPVTRQTPPPEAEAIFDAIAEDGLDEAIAAEEQSVASERARRVDDENALRSHEAGKVDPSEIRKRQRAFTRRQSTVSSRLPLARLRRATRVISVLCLVAVLAIAYFGRVQVVERFPAMAGVYEQVGLPVNVVGLDFSNVTTLRSLREGKEIMSVSAQIFGLMPSPVRVPQVRITLLDADGASIYEWNVSPNIADLMAGERATFDTQLAMPPGEASRVRLSFDGASVTSKPAAAAESAAAPQAPPPASHAEPQADHGAAEPTPTPAPEHH